METVAKVWILSISVQNFSQRPLPVPPFRNCHGKKPTVICSQYKTRDRAPGGTSEYWAETFLFTKVFGLLKIVSAVYL